MYGNVKITDRYGNAVIYTNPLNIEVEQNIQPLSYYSSDRSLNFVTKDSGTTETDKGEEMRTDSTKTVSLTREELAVVLKLKKGDRITAVQWIKDGNDSPELRVMVACESKTSEPGAGFASLTD